MNQLIPLSFHNKISLTIKREDLLHPHISGNKYRKLKYNIAEAINQGSSTLLTFGGAYSNHIAAAAAAGKKYGLNIIGIIRGDELQDKAMHNPTLKFAADCGMKLHFISREAYREKHTPEFIAHLQREFGEFYLLPEGGTNALAIKGCEEILRGEDSAFTHICCAVGTGGTVSGIIKSAGGGQQVLGFPVLKNEALLDDITKFAGQGNWKLVNNYHFGGYGKVTEELVAFMNSFYEKTGIPLDPVYTAKMVFGVIDMAGKGCFPENSRILMIHTGGLQGIEGMNRELKRKKLSLIKI
ncbi:pyridoxal-phosphate dependent enzyme [Flavobacterium sp.]|uniref:1-aminocyclopropane-1-carboxylate deaminase/D-cysteine desulfhydrase n=1 Tax=Flavobacterium sp. TaxID=239 RepID=UPI00261FE39B|nr:pyridoxal-phosphate dependent enzyme [Flavobacterium sp.]